MWLGFCFVWFFYHICGDLHPNETAAVTFLLFKCHLMNYMIICQLMCLGFYIHWSKSSTFGREMLVPDTILPLLRLCMVVVLCSVPENTVPLSSLCWKERHAILPTFFEQNQMLKTKKLDLDTKPVQCLVQLAAWQNGWLVFPSSRQPDWVSVYDGGVNFFTCLSTAFWTLV